VTNGPNVHVRLIAFEFLLRHLFLSSSNQSLFLLPLQILNS
jgi:hypothetical protein